MSEWISYETGDASPEEVSFDAELDDAAFREARPYALSITLRGFPVDTDGQPDDDASERLYEIETRIESALTKSGASLACTVSGNGALVLYAYAPDAHAETSLAAAAQDAAYPCSVTGERDPDWRAYERYALRGDELEQARDAEQLNQRVEIGDDLSEPREVDFAISFATSGDAARAIEPLRHARFSVPPLEYLEGATTFDATRRIALSPESLHAARSDLTRAIATCGGTYRGWSADVMDEDSGEVLA